jgi:NADH-quinone oxidoreductase subunit D
MEKLLEGQSIEAALAIVARVCGICESAHEQAYIRAIESMLRYRPPLRVRYLRTLIAELERIHSHLLWAGFMAHEIGYETLFAFFWRERERILEIFERITGGRVHHAFGRIRTVAVDLQRGDERFILERIAKVERKISGYFGVYGADRIIRARLEGVGPITKQQARRFCLVGPVARASGIDNDVRRADPYAAYRDIDFDVIVDDRGDAAARTAVRLREVLESVKIIRQVLRDMPAGRLPHYRLCVIETAHGTGRVEAPRGENFHFINIKGGIIDRARIRTPTYNNIIILEHMLLGQEIGDVPVILASLDPCFGCMERVLIVRGRHRELLTEKQFRRRYCA